MADSTASTPNAHAASVRFPGLSRRLLLVGAGPLPESGSRAAPGVPNRLWHFLQPALAAGHDCLVVSIEPGAPPLPGGTAPPRPATRTWRETVWQTLAVRAEDCPSSPALEHLVTSFRPEAAAGVGTLLAAATACALAGEAPAWADLFGDPLAEAAARADVLGAGAAAEDVLLVWRLQMGVLARADAFSSVSRRQADALLGQLLAAGRLAGAPPIHPIPCAVETLDLLEGLERIRPADWKRAHGLPPDACVALWTGGFNAWADPETLVIGVGRAMDADPRLHLVATGGELPGYLKQVYERFTACAAASPHAGRIHALGWLPFEEAAQWLLAADFGLLADRPCAETRLGARNRLLYFAAAECPIVASRGAEVVADMEEAGALVGFEPDDPDALARAVGELLLDAESRRWVGRRDREFCRERYTFAATTGPFLEFAAHSRRHAAVGAATLHAPGAPHASPAPNPPVGAAQAEVIIRRYLDIPAHEGEWAELARRRSGLAGRLRRLLGGR